MVDEFIAKTKRNVEGLQPEERKEILQEAFRRAGRMMQDDREAMAVSESVEGMYRMVWMHLRKEHPDITMQTVSDLLNDPALLAEAMAKIKQATGKTHKVAKAPSPKAKGTRKVPTNVQQRRRRK